jgi:hypothetical protein
LADAAVAEAFAWPQPPPPLDVGAPALLATFDGLRGLLGAAVRALVRDLSLPEPDSAAWWLEPSHWFDPDAQHAPTTNDGRASSPGAQHRKVESAFSGDAWAQFLADAPPSAQVFQTQGALTLTSKRAAGLPLLLGADWQKMLRVFCWLNPSFVFLYIFELYFFRPISFPSFTLRFSRLAISLRHLLCSHLNTDTVAAHVRPRGRSGRAPLSRPLAPRQRFGPPRHN